MPGKKGQKKSEPWTEGSDQTLLMMYSKPIKPVLEFSALDFTQAVMERLR
jgi:hypothetical protein